jgi:hypothetical protein
MRMMHKPPEPLAVGPSNAAIVVPVPCRGGCRLMRLLTVSESVPKLRNLLFTAIPTTLCPGWEGNWRLLPGRGCLGLRKAIQTAP